MDFTVKAIVKTLMERHHLTHLKGVNSHGKPCQCSRDNLMCCGQWIDGGDVGNCEAVQIFQTFNVEKKDA
jgi:hypothetical protein